MTTAISCVVDDTLKIWASLIPWLATASSLSSEKRCELHLHHVCPLRRDIEEICMMLGVACHKIDAFDRRSPHANKILQCLSDFGGAERVVLTDVDVVFRRDIPFHDIKAPVAGKCVDHPNPPLQVLENVFKSARVRCPSIHSTGFWSASGAWVEFETFSGNFNGGLYVLDARVILDIGKSWSFWAKWLLSRIELLDRWTIQVDQVSFCLAVCDLGIQQEVLDQRWNFPYHLNHSQVNEEPFVLHHHMAVSPKGGSDNAVLKAWLSDVNETIIRFAERFKLSHPALFQVLIIMGLGSYSKCLFWQ